jgi:hypothetical protein
MVQPTMTTRISPLNDARKAQAAIKPAIFAPFPNAFPILFHPSARFVLARPDQRPQYDRQP